MAPQQQLPQPVQRAVTELARPFGERLALLGRLRRIAGRADLRQRDAVHRFEQPAQHRPRIDAQIILLGASAASAPGAVAGEHQRRADRASRRDRTGRASRAPASAVIAAAFHARHARSPGRGSTGRRAPSLRPRARSAPAPRARPRRLPLARHAREMRGELSRPGCAAGRSAGSATAPSPAPCSTSVVANRNFTCAGGSSSVFSSALNAFFDSMWTSSMM